MLPRKLNHNGPARLQNGMMRTLSDGVECRGLTVMTMMPRDLPSKRKCERLRLSCHSIPENEGHVFVADGLASSVTEEAGMLAQLLAR